MNLDDDLAARIALAQITPAVLDEMRALKACYDLTQARCANAPDIEEQIALTKCMASVMQEANDLREEFFQRAHDYMVGQIRLYKQLIEEGP